MTSPWYFGHYQGHWLSATAFLINGTRDEGVRTKVRTKADDIIFALEATMDAWAAKYGAEHDGYLFPLDPIVFHYLHTNSRGCDEHLCGLYSVPYYTWHKMMAGLLDQYTHAASARSLKMVLRMAAWVERHARGALAAGGQALWQQVLATEWGGMNEVLFNLYALTADPAHLRTGRLFNHWTWSAPLAAGIDDLAGNHANTHIPEVLGNVVGFELTANATDHAIALEFWSAITQNHSWATGGSNDGEYWGAPRRLGDSLDGNTEESCTQYNILKVARHLFLWSANVSLADFYEKALFNGIVGNQKREPDATSFIYMLPLGGARMRKPWGDATRSFPCCWGTLSEQLAKLADSIYFQSAPGAPPALYVNLFVASTVQFAAAGVSLRQSTSFPVDMNRTTTLTIGALDGEAGGVPADDGMPSAARRFALMLRVPSWATTGGNALAVNGEPVDRRQLVAGRYHRIERVWAVGDTVVVHFPLAFHSTPLNDDRDAFNATVAYMYGPLVLASVGDVSAFHWFVPDGNASDPAGFLERTSAEALEFVAHGQLYAPAGAVHADAIPAGAAPVRAAHGADTSGADTSAHLARPATLNESRVRVARSMRMAPLYAVVDETYTVYFDSKMSTLPYDARGAVLPSTSPADLLYTDGASSARGPTDSRCTGRNVRSGDPGQVGRIVFAHPLFAPGYVIDKLSLTFRYAAGYTPPAGRNVTSPTLRILLSDTNNRDLATVFEAAELGNYSFDDFTQCAPPFASTTSPDTASEDLVHICAFVARAPRARPPV